MNVIHIIIGMVKIVVDQHQDIVMLRSSTLDCYLTGHSDSSVVDGRVHNYINYTYIYTYIYHKGLYMVRAMQPQSLIAKYMNAFTVITSSLLFIEWCSDRDIISTIYTGKLY